MTGRTTGRWHPSVEQRAESLKERLYLTFTSLAVVLVLGTRTDGTTAAGAAATLAITVIGTLLAVFVADLLSHVTVHAALPTASEFRDMLSVSVGSIGVVALPLAFLGLAGLGAWSTEDALQASTVILVATLAAVSWLAVRRVALAGWLKVVMLLAEVLLSVAVIGLQLLAHG